MTEPAELASKGEADQYWLTVSSTTAQNGCVHRVSGEDLLMKVLVREHARRGAFVCAHLSYEFSERNTVPAIEQGLRIDDTGNAGIEDAWWQISRHLRGSDFDNASSGG